MVDKHRDFWDKLFDFSTQMSAASLAVVGLLLVVTYEFWNSRDLAGAHEWMQYVHMGIFAVIAFSLSAFAGLIYKATLPEKWRKCVSYFMGIVFITGWVILLILLVIFFLETHS